MSEHRVPTVLAVCASIVLCAVALLVGLIVGQYRGAGAAVAAAPVVEGSGRDREREQLAARVAEVESERAADAKARELERGELRREVERLESQLAARQAEETGTKAESVKYLGLTVNDVARILDRHHEGWGFEATSIAAFRESDRELTITYTAENVSLVLGGDPTDLGHVAIFASTQDIPSLARGLVIVTMLLDALGPWDADEVNAWMATNTKAIRAGEPTAPLEAGGMRVTVDQLADGPLMFLLNRARDE